ncbi:MAG: hypothetical protein ACE5F8_05130 [Woeseiaceae bacterium]
MRPNGAYGTVGRFNLRLAASALTTTPNGDTAPEQCFFVGDTAVNQNDNTTNELIDLGRMTVPSFAQHANDKLSRLAFAFEGKCPSGTAGTLHIYQIILIPIDELAFVASSYNPRDQNLIAFSNIDYPVGVLEIDAGVLVRGARLVSFRPGLSDQRSLLAQWIVGGELPVLRPATQYRLFFLVSSRKSNDAMGTRESLASSSLVATIYSHDRWAMLRGSN